MVLVYIIVSLSLEFLFSILLRLEQLINLLTVFSENMFKQKNFYSYEILYLFSGGFKILRPQPKLLLEEICFDVVKC